MTQRNPNPNQRRSVPREIYQRRRVAAVVIGVVVLALLWWIIASLTGGDPENTAASQSTSATSRSVDATSPAEPPNGKKKEPKASSSASSSSSSSSSATTGAAAKKDSCTLNDLKITATPGAPFFGPDQQPNFFVQIENPTGADCEIDADTSPLSFEVFTLNNYQRVWADTDCNPSEITGELKVPAGESLNYELGAWSRTTSAPNACEARQPVGPGSYLLYGHLGEAVSEPATFNLG